MVYIQTNTQAIYPFDKINRQLFIYPLILIFIFNFNHTFCLVRAKRVLALCYSLRGKALLALNRRFINIYIQTHLMTLTTVFHIIFSPCLSIRFQSFSQSSCPIMHLDRDAPRHHPLATAGNRLTIENRELGFPSIVGHALSHLGWRMPVSRSSFTFNKSLFFTQCFIFTHF